MAEINLSVAYLNIFGQSTSAFEPVFSKVPGNAKLNPDIPARKEYGKAGGAKYYDVDAYGREYFMPVTLSYTESTPTGVDDDTVDVVKEIKLPYPIVAVNSHKTIVDTPLTERTGSVKEYVNIGGYAIVVRGFLIGQKNEFPEDELTAIRNLYELKMPLDISNVITDIFLVRPERKAQVVIDNFRLLDNPGKPSVRGYEFVMVSDEPFNLIDIS